MFMFIVPLYGFLLICDVPRHEISALCFPAIILIFSFHFWDRPRIYFSSKFFAISFDGVKVSLVLSSLQIPELFHQCVMTFVQAALPCEGNEKVQRSSCQCLLHIETILRKILRNEDENHGERGKGKQKKNQKKTCCNIFIAVCALSTELCLPLWSCCFCGWSGNNELCNPGHV